MIRIEKRHLAYAGYVALTLAFSMLLIMPFPFSLLPIVLIAGLVFVVFTFRNPIVGVLIYLFVFFVKPNEIFPSISALALPYERLVAFVVLGRLAANIAFFEKRIKIVPMDIAIAAFFLAVFLSTFGAIDLFSAKLQMTDLFKVLLVYFFLVRLIEKEGDFKSVIWLYAMSIGFLACYSVYNYYSGNFLTRQGINRAYIPGGGSYADPNSLATSLILGIPFIIALARTYKKTFLRLLLAGISLICFWTIVITGSRGGMVGGIVLIAMLAFHSKHRVIAFATTALAFLVFVTFVPDEYVERFKTIGEVSSGEDGAAQSARGRIEGLKAGLAFFIERPLTGVGIGNFPFHFALAGKGWFEPHNMVAKLIGELGLLGIISFSFFIFTYYKALKRIRKFYVGKLRPPDFYLHIRTAILVALLMLFVQGLFGHNLYRFNWYIFAAFLAIDYSLMLQKHSAPEKAPQAIRTAKVELTPLSN
jgi:O-antigen ligase